MALSAAQFSEEEAERSSGLARDIALDMLKRTRDKGVTSVTVKERTRAWVPDQTASLRGTARFASPNSVSMAAPAYDNGFLDDMREDDEPLAAASPAFVRPEPSRSASDPRQTVDTSNKTLSPASRDVPTEQNDTNGSENDPLSVHNAPLASQTAPLVSEHGEPLGLLAGTDGNGESSAAPPTDPASTTTSEESAANEQTAQQYVTATRETQDAQRVAQDTARYIRAFEGKRLEQEQRAQTLDKRIEEQKKRVKPLKGAWRIDFAKIIWWYWGAMASFTAGFWWFLIVGVIIDVFLVIPFVAIICWTGAYKGMVRVRLEQALQHDKDKLKRLENERRVLNREMRELRQAQARVTERAYMEAGAQRERNTAKRGLPPTVGGISLSR